MKCGTFLAPPAPAFTPAEPQPAPRAVPPRDAGFYSSEPIAEPKSKIAAAVLAFTFGSLGLHNFYLGYKTKGLIQLLITLCTCGYALPVTIIWSLVEMVMILTGSIKQDAEGVPLAE